MAEIKTRRSCWPLESLSLAATHKLASVAFPCISTGIYDYPAEQAAEVTITAVRDFLYTPCSLQEVIFCCYLASDLALYQSALARTKCPYHAAVLPPDHLHYDWRSIHSGEQP